MNAGLILILAGVGAMNKAEAPPTATATARA